MLDDIKQEIIELQKLYPEPRSALIPALHLAQSEKGYLPKETQEEVAKLFNLDPNEVHAVVSFYDMFFDKPTGKNIIHVCKNVSCMLRGCDSIIKQLCDRLKIAPGETTVDGEYTLIASECLGACDRAPMMLFNEEVIGPIDNVDKILEDARHE